MLKYNIHILCLQETRKPLSDYSITEKGFILILSGKSNTEEREYAGVGFLIAPSIRSTIIGFCQHSNRIACLKIRVPGGKAAILSCYAPHAGRDFEERLGYFQDLAKFWKSVSSYGPKLCLGDFNSRLYCRFAEEEQIIGKHFFKNKITKLRPTFNRYLLIKFCTQFDIQIANTFFDKPDERLVT